jgi:hypothetical protein
MYTTQERALRKLADSLAPGSRDTSANSLLGGLESSFSPDKQSLHLHMATRTDLINLAAHESVEEFHCSIVGKYVRVSMEISTMGMVGRLPISYLICEVLAVKNCNANCPVYHVHDPTMTRGGRRRIQNYLEVILPPGDIVIMASNIRPFHKCSCFVLAFVFAFVCACVIVCESAGS